jgi:sulfite exporter TauE/SafE
MNLWTVFITGLFTGALTCLAVQGGLLATSIAQSEEEKLKEKTKRTGNALPILSFLGSKLIAYTILGFLLGGLGRAFNLSLGTQTFLQFAVGIFMLGTAFNLLNVHPIFRYFVIQPPRFLTRIVRKQSKNGNLFGPAILGFFTVLIPCGTTQAMMALAVASGNPLSGAAILFAFVLGTSPLFFILGYFATKLGDAMHQQFMKVAAYAIILLAVFNINNAIALTGSGFTLENAWNGVWCTVSFCNESPTAAAAQGNGANSQAANITIESGGYNPTSIAIKAGSQVTLNIKNTGGTGCTQAFTIPKLGIQKTVPIGTSDTITFTAPSTTGELAFMCSMGMFRGKFNVI